MTLTVEKFCLMVNEAPSSFEMTQALGKNVKDLNVRWLRHQIGYVGQEPVLFKGSIKENILKGEMRTFLMVNHCHLFQAWPLSK